MSARERPTCLGSREKIFEKNQVEMWGQKMVEQMRHATREAIVDEARKYVGLRGEDGWSRYFEKQIDWNKFPEVKRPRYLIDRGGIN